MIIYAVIAFILFEAVSCRPDIQTPHGNFSTEPLSPRDREWVRRTFHEYRGSYPPGFKFLYVAQDGRISSGTRPAGDWVRVVGSPQLSDKILYVAALDVYKMLKHAASDIFQRIARSPSGVGVFTAQEQITIFPDMARAADTPACRGRCDGSCSHTCTADGRKVSTIGGMASTLAMVLADNVMCTGADPYHRHDNILVHEFGHIIDSRGLSTAMRQQKEDAYSNAKAHSLWRAGTYAMSNSAEYFAEATGAYFLVNLQDSTGGMNMCSYGRCHNEMDARYHIYHVDVKLFNLLATAYTHGHSDLPSGLSVCPK